MCWLVLAFCLDFTLRKISNAMLVMSERYWYCRTFRLFWTWVLGPAFCRSLQFKPALYECTPSKHPA